MTFNNELDKSLRKILSEIDGAKNVNRAEMLVECVTSRLEKSLESYYHDISLAIDNMNSIKSDLKLMKKLNRL